MLTFMAREHPVERLTCVDFVSGMELRRPSRQDAVGERQRDP